MARTRQLRWVLYPSFLIVIAFCLLVVGTYTVVSVRSLFITETESRLKGRADLVAALIEQAVPGDPRTVERLVSTAAGNLASRITVILPDGRVLADSAGEARSMENHRDRPEVSEAMRKGWGKATRRSRTQAAEMVYFARTIQRDGGTVGVVRVAMPLNEVDAALWDLVWKTVLGGVLAAVLAAFISWLVARRVARPVEKMAASVKGMLDEGFVGRVDPPNIAEYSTLATAMNQMADGLRERLAATGTQQKELETTLSGMSEAVLLLDVSDRIRLLNAAAEKMLRIGTVDAAGRGVFEIVADGPLKEFIARPLGGGDPVEEEISVESDKLRFVHAFKTAIRDDAGRFTGTLLVLHDITRLKRLEAIRRDFVANVSHELKTPITSIKGFVETLRSGEEHDPETVKRFLDIIARHTDRLNSIIEDLLVLSRIEQAENVGRGSGEEDPGMARENVLVSSIVESAVMVCEPRAARKNIALNVTCQPDAIAFVNQQLMEQALVNLVDNAVKYSDQDRSVAIDARVVDERLTLTVTDNGCGIPKEDQARIFERFYRVDKGRSRAAGGTGLGLSIVRHVATIHGGKVRVTSEPGTGSTFVIDVPARPGSGEGS